MGDRVTLKLCNITLKEARAFVAAHHSHNRPPQGWCFGVGVVSDGRLVAVGTAGRPVARLLDDGRTLEITRVATDHTRMACSMVYGALCRAGAALGWRSAITYTLESECAACIKASGFVSTSSAGSNVGFDGGNRYRVETNLFGERLRPDGPKRLWRRELVRG